MSFRVTISASRTTDRGFSVEVDRDEGRVYVRFDPDEVIDHQEWLGGVANRTSGKFLNPEPYWSFEKLSVKTQNKLKNTIYVVAESKIQGGEEYFHYTEALILEGFSFDSFLRGLEDGRVMIDFDARTGHNHGTKFRIRRQSLRGFYSSEDRFGPNL